ncbi:ABC transporter substrate-binding protein [Streptomyces alboniger]|uniref:Amino acid ABC transporter substrate-binding protein n=1 Tax=Streptomyces alboniger TaxID=132473 RepID=A0A5J6H9L8_STRAD|nr:ABC transporter substrate-binding protein [Streptomyces alboniger]QEV16816.1 amino acid ABC transporter substrate-binding protein [Streptomyces alboniger]
MLFRRHPREWGPIEWAAVLGLALVAGVAVVVVTLGARGPGKCGDDLRELGGDCVGVTESAFHADPRLKSLIAAVAEENAEVRRDAESPADNGAKIPYVRIALMMPYTSDESSAMTTDMIRRALAGALAAQQEANSGSGPHYQLLLAPDGRNLDHWEPVVERLSELAKDKSAPLVGVTGIPSSTPETRRTIAALSEHGIPTVGPVITAADMNAGHFFKTSPNNDQFARALKQYLEKRPERGKGFLVWDNRSEDVYSRNLRRVFEKHFDDAYDFKGHNSNFTGSSGADKGIPQRFTDAVQKICTARSDTVFFAGRDQDLPAFVKRLAQEGDCGRGSVLRLLKVGIGLEPTLTTDETTRWLKEARATIVDASSVDPAWWDGKNDPPRALGRFLDRFGKLDRQHELGTAPLNDGYAVMYHDAFTLLADAVDRTYSEINEGAGKPKGKGAPLIPTKNDVYNTLIMPSISANGCSNCLRGAAGSYGFEGPGANDQWAVCKPVPIVEYPAARSGRASKEPLPLYRTFRDGDKGGKKACPD